MRWIHFEARWINGWGSGAEVGSRGNGCLDACEEEMGRNKEVEAELATEGVEGGSKEVKGKEKR